MTETTTRVAVPDSNVHPIALRRYKITTLAL
jgi:hypothetical protein